MKKFVVFFLWLCVPLASWAEIYKCKDSHQKLIYQDTPCKTKQIGKVAPASPLSQADELRARERRDRLFEENRYYDQKRREAARLRQEELRRLEEQEAREREWATAEAREQGVYIPMYRPGYPYGGYRYRDQPATQPKRSWPCVIGFVGDRSCR